MNRRTFALIGLLLCSTAYAAGTSIWNATDRGTVAATDRLPVATSSSSGPLYVTPLTLQSYLLSSSATTEVLANNAGAFDGDSGFTFNATNNSVDLGGGTLTASDPVLDLSQTWNNAEVTFEGIKLAITSTASATASRPVVVAVGGSHVFAVDKVGTVYAGGSTSDAAIFGKGSFNADAYIGVDFYFANGTGFFGASNNVIGFATSSNPGSTTPTLQAGFYSDAAGVIAQRNTTTAQTLRVYDTYTDSSNYGRIALNTNLTGDWVQVAAETAGTAGDNYGIALTPTGSGAISAQVPDSGTAGGNARGPYAIDWQRYRSAANQVASGEGAVIAGGTIHTASGPYSTVGGGFTNTASGEGSVIAGGSLSTASGEHSVIGGGFTNTASGTQSTVAGGILNVASGMWGAIGGGRENAAGLAATVAGGYGNIADGAGSWIPGGSFATTRGIVSAYAYASSFRAATGDAQVIGQPVRRTTTDATPVSLAADGTPAATTVMVLPASSTLMCTAMVVAQSASAANNAGYQVLAVIQRDGSSNTALVGTATTTTVGEDTAGMDATIIANDTLESAEIQVTGVAATTIQWMGELKCVQVL